MRIYKFSKTAKDKPKITAQQLIEQMKDSNRYTFGTQNLLSCGIFQLNGWAFNIQDELNEYVYEQYGDWHKVYAPDKTTVRKLVGGRISRIVEV